MFLEYLLKHDAFEAAAPRLRRGAAAYAPSFFAPYLLAGAVRDAGAEGWLVVAPDGDAATRLATDLALYLDRPVPVLPARGVLYGADVAPAPHVVGERQQALTELARGGVVVVEAVALLERFLPLELQPRPLALAPGAELPFDGAVARLAALGYERVEQVRGRGEFAVRGGLIDAYPALGDPLRVEFWGDEVDTLRTFSVYSQRTTGNLEQATVWAAFEADTELAEYQTGLHQAIAAWEREGREEAPDELYRRAGVRALAALAGRFTTAARPGGRRGSAPRRVQPGRDLPRPGRLRRRGRHGHGRRGPARAALRAARAGPRPAGRSPADGPRAARPARAVRAPRGRSSRRAT